MSDGIEKKRNIHGLLKSKKLLGVIVFALIASGLLMVFFIKTSDKNNEEIIKSDTGKTYESPEQFIKESANTVEGKRRYLTVLVRQKKYIEAKDYAISILNETKSIEDGSRLVQLCQASDLQNKADCANEAKSVILEKYKSLNFYDSYALAEIYEKFGDKDLSAKLFKNSLDKYSEYKTDGELALMTRQELENKINSLIK